MKKIVALLIVLLSLFFTLQPVAAFCTGCSGKEVTRACPNGGNQVGCFTGSTNCKPTTCPVAAL